MFFAIERINRILKDLAGLSHNPVFAVDDIRYRPCGYNEYELVSASAEEWDRYALHQNWGGIDQHYWFRTTLGIPQELAGRKVILLVKTGRTGWDALNPQFLAFVNGKVVQGLDVNHTEILLADKAKAGEEYVIDLYAYTGMQEAYTELELQLCGLEGAVERLYYHIQVPLQVAQLQDDQDIHRITILNHLTEAVNLLDLRQPGSKDFHASVKKALDYMDKHFYGEACGDDTVMEICVGHTHIDVAWLWTLGQTREKAVRSFATVVNLMKQYPDYVFMSSQPQLYQFVKEDCPELYAEIKAMVEAGRWEVEGAMWLEADCNLASGESLVRQIVHGKRFMREEFGVDSKILWLPDVFGYSAALPQILKRSGVDYFMTTKISWNEFNRMPYDTFMWQGLDGTEVLTYFISTQDYNKDKPVNFTTYNGDTTPTQVLGCWNRYQQKEINRTVLNCFGFGDGGGGPTKPMLERLERTDKGLPGMPMTRKGLSLPFFRQLEKTVGKNKRLPKWVGELYLEYHRGTYTSIARNKRYNRKIEFLNQETEWLATLASLLAGADYPQEQLTSIWRTTLLNQFHDIIPGSSIRQVYEESQEQYQQIFGEDEALVEDALSALVAEIDAQEPSIVVFNALGITRSDIVEVTLPADWEDASVWDGETALPCQRSASGDLLFIARAVPAFGYKTFTLRRAAAPLSGSGDVSKRGMENDFFSLKIDGDGSITSLVDKRSGREVLQTGARGNVLQVFEDKPFEYDAWNLEIYYQEKMWEVGKANRIEVVESGPVRWALRVRRTFLNSTIEQTYYLYSEVARIDFDTTIDWKEADLVLKAAFPVDVHANRATYEIQYGNVERPTHWNTSWDWARFEVCAHKWADLSEGGYGVSLLNDCKYGHDIRDGVMRLTLLKAATYPNEDADREVHKFVYSLYPHAGGWREAQTPHLAYGLNVPLRAAVTQGNQGSQPALYSLAACDAENVMIEVIKQAEDGDGVIVRMYEYMNQRSKPTVTLGKQPKSVVECDLLENEIGAVTQNANGFIFEMRPYEIRTFRVRF